MIFTMNEATEAREIVNANFAKSSGTKKVKMPTKEVGIEHLRSDGDEFTTPLINADKIWDLRNNIYAAMTIFKLARMLFVSKDNFFIEAINVKKNEVDEKSSLVMMNMADRIDVWSLMEQHLYSKYWWGNYIANHVWGTDPGAGIEGNQLLSVSHRHSYTFKTAPPGRKIYSDILPGITLDDKGDMEFWQEPAPSETPKLLPTESIFFAKDPISNSIAGDPTILPAIPVINMLSRGWMLEGMHMEQVGSGGKLLIQFTSQPQAKGVRGRAVSDIDHVNTLMKNWKKSMGGVVWDNMTPIDPKTKHDTNNLDSIAALTNLLTEFISIKSFASSDQTTKLGGNDSTMKEMFYDSLISMQQKIATPWEKLFAQYFTFNGFAPGEFRVKFHIPTPSQNDREQNRKDADSGYLGQDMTVNERRKMRGQKSLSDKELADLKQDFMDRVKSPQLIKPQ